MFIWSPEFMKPLNQESRICTLQTLPRECNLRRRRRVVGGQSFKAQLTRDPAALSCILQSDENAKGDIYIFGPNQRNPFSHPRRLVS